MTPVVLVPGLLCSAEIWTSQLAALWSYGPVQIASTTEGTSVGELAALILDAAPPRFALAGISMGGYLCFEIMRQAPQRVLKLALLDTSALPDTPEQSDGRRQLVEQLRGGDFETLVGDALTAILHPAHQHDPGLRAINVRMGTTVGLDGFARQTEAAITRPDSRPTLPTIDVPTLVLVGDADPLTPLERAEEIAAGIENSTLVVIDECGHGSTLEQPEAVTAALVDWIRR